MIHICFTFLFKICQISVLFSLTESRCICWIISVSRHIWKVRPVADVRTITIHNLWLRSKVAISISIGWICEIVLYRHWFIWISIHIYWVSVINALVWYTRTVWSWVWGRNARSISIRDVKTCRNARSISSRDVKSWIIQTIFPRLTWKSRIYVVGCTIITQYITVSTGIGPCTPVVWNTRYIIEIWEHLLIFIQPQMMGQKYKTPFRVNK